MLDTKTFTNNHDCHTSPNLGTSACEYILCYYIQELRQGKNSLDGKEEDGSLDSRRDKAGGDGVEAYSGQKMKKAYYKAFWRAKCVKSSLDGALEMLDAIYPKYIS